MTRGFTQFWGQGDPITTCPMIANNSLPGKRGNMAFHLWIIGIIAPSITVLVLVYLWAKEMRNSVRKARQNRTYGENEHSKPTS